MRLRAAGAVGIAVLACVVAGTAAGELEGPPPVVRYASGEVLVKLRHATDALELTRTAASALAGPRLPRRPGLDATLGHFQVAGARRLFPAGRAAALGLDRLVLLALRPGAGPAQAQRLAARLAADPAVEYAHPNVLLQVAGTTNDPYLSSAGSWGQDFQDLWALHRIQAPSAWDVTRGTGVVVAVVDTGVDYNHEDLAANIWTNPGETGPDAAGRDRRSNGRDDDGNGLVDDWRGWDFLSGDNDPADPHGHGTHLAGLIAAVGDNGVGVVGVAHRARILPLRVADLDGYAAVSRVVEAIAYAAAAGARVVNLGLFSGHRGFRTPQALVDAIAYAHDVKGAVVVAAAGNYGRDIGAEFRGVFPANVRDVITVGSSDREDAKDFASGHGVEMDLAAPGNGQFENAGGVPHPGLSVPSLKSSAASPLFTARGALVLGERYLRRGGSSVAAALTSGVAALVRAVHPDWGPEQVRQALRAGADDLAPAGFDADTGYGRLNAARAVRAAAPLAVQLTTAVRPRLASDAPLAVRGTASGPGLTSWRLEWGAGAAPTAWTPIASSTLPASEAELGSWDTSSLPDGDYTLRLSAASAAGGFEDRMLVEMDNVAVEGPFFLTLDVLSDRGGAGVVAYAATPGGGSGTCPGVPRDDQQCVFKFHEGESVLLTATPASNASFAGWGGACAGTGPCTLVMSEDRDVIATFRPENHRPVAIAGGPYAGVRGQAVVLDGSGSADPDGDDLTYQWGFGDGTSGAGARPAHVYMRLGTFSAQLVVSDGLINSTPAVATVTIRNRPPLADAGPDQVVDMGAVATLSAAGSSDPDGDPLAYEWRQGAAVVGRDATVELRLPPGVHEIGLTVSDGVGGSATDTVRVSVRDLAPPTVAITAPAAGGVLLTGVPVAVTWTAQDTSGLRGFDVLHSTDGGASFNPVPRCSGLGAAVRRCQWNAPASAAEQGRIRVVARDGAGNSGNTDVAVRVVAAAIQLASPNGGESWAIGSRRRLSWTHNLPPGSTVHIDVSRNDGASWTRIAGGVANTGAFTWTVSPPATAAARIRVSWTRQASAAGASDAAFAIAPAFVRVTAPEAASTWDVGTVQTIAWSHNLGTAESVRLEVSRNGGTSWALLAASLPNAGLDSGSLAWTVTGPPTTRARFRVRWTRNAAVQDGSDVDVVIR